MRILVIGDIHGSYRALLQCLERSNFDYKKDTLISLGDIVDGWSEVYECVEELLKIGNLIPIKGNHDEWFNQFIKTGVHPVEWMQGGEGTKKSYMQHCNSVDQGEEVFIDVPDSHKRFFASQHLYYIDDCNRIFVHGGFDRDQPVSQTKQLRPHDFYWNRSLWNKALSVKEGRLATYDHFETIFIGHTTTINWETDKPMYSGGIWNLDTGAGYFGKLTIMDVETWEFWQSDPVQNLYVNETGRN